MRQPLAQRPRARAFGAFAVLAVGLQVGSRAAVDVAVRKQPSVEASQVAACNDAITLPRFLRQTARSLAAGGQSAQHGFAGGSPRNLG